MKNKLSKFKAEFDLLLDLTVESLSMVITSVVASNFNNDLLFAWHHKILMIKHGEDGVEFVLVGVEN